MTGLRKRGEEIRSFILAHVAGHPTGIVALTATTFGISRQAVNKHMQRLTRQKALAMRGTTRDRHYLLRPLLEQRSTYPIDDTLAEDTVWRKDMLPLLEDLPDNVLDIWQYAFTEMLNNVIDHSSGRIATVEIKKTSLETAIILRDDGEGIFKKIQRTLNLLDINHAVLELSKGKLTTDPSRHTGEGIFFTSKMFDEFHIQSGDVCFAHFPDGPEDCVSELQDLLGGTLVYMNLKNNSTRTTREVFEKFSAEDDLRFVKTVIPVRLVRYGKEKLVSRSQAKRLLARVDQFESVIFDFAGIEEIGQAFADEVFRVFRLEHTNIELLSVNASDYVLHMIERAESAAGS